jgi:polysaccharide pyruvyl transferase WcaK-like protein
MIYHVFANKSNIGDWLSARGIQQLLTGKKITECFCDVPFVEETIFKLKKATPEDLIIIGGGGLLMDYFVPFWTSFRSISHKIPFCVWGIGYCDIKQELSLPPAALLEDILGRSKLCVVRDEMSRVHLQSLNLEPPVQCPSVCVINSSLEKTSDVLHVVNYSTVGETAYELMCKSAKEFTSINKTVYRQTNNLIQAGNKVQLEGILNLYRGSGYVLSSALHGCIIAAAMGKKVLAVSGDRKIEGFMNSIGLDEWVLEQNETDTVLEKLQILDQQKDVINDIDNIRDANKRIALKINSFMQNN